MLVWNQQIITWTVYDYIRYDHNPMCYLANVLPSLLPKNVQSNIYSKTVELITKFVHDHGFDNQFLELEWFVKVNNDGSYHLNIMEINPRIPGLDVQCYLNLSSCQVEAILKLSSGAWHDVQSPSILKFDDGVEKVAISGGVHVIESGKAENMLNFEEIKNLLEENRYVCLAYHRALQMIAFIFKKVCIFYCIKSLHI